MVTTRPRPEAGPLPGSRAAGSSRTSRLRCDGVPVPVAWLRVYQAAQPVECARPHTVRVPGRRSVGVAVGLAGSVTAPPPIGHREGEILLDAVDLRIVRELLANGRKSNRDVAAAAGVAPSTSLERIRSLQERGVIKGFHADVDLAALGRTVQALIAVRIRPPSRHNIERFRDWVAGLPETRGVFVTSGVQDFLIHVAVADTDGLYAFVIDRLTERAEVADVHTSVIYAHLQSVDFGQL